jgi:hypothetical protein
LKPATLIAFDTAPLVASSTCLAEADSLPPSPTSKATDPELGTENEVKETFMGMSFGRLNFSGQRSLAKREHVKQQLTFRECDICSDGNLVLQWLVLSCGFSLNQGVHRRFTSRTIRADSSRWNR